MSSQVVFTVIGRREEGSFEDRLYYVYQNTEESSVGYYSPAAAWEAAEKAAKRLAEETNATKCVYTSVPTFAEVTTDQTNRACWLVEYE